MKKIEDVYGITAKKPIFYTCYPARPVAYDDRLFIRSVPVAQRPGKDMLPEFGRAADVRHIFLFLYPPADVPIAFPVRINIV